MSRGERSRRVVPTSLERLPLAVRERIVEQSLALYQHDRAAFALAAKLVTHLSLRR